MLQERLQEALAGSRRDSSMFQKPSGGSRRLREAPAKRTVDFHRLSVKSVMLFSICVKIVISLWFCKLLSKKSLRLKCSSKVLNSPAVRERHFSKCRSSFIGRTPQNQRNLTRRERNHIEVRTLNAGRMLRKHLVLSIHLAILALPANDVMKCC